MVKVAVAGGTGGIGQHIVEGILETKKHDVVVLSRKDSFPALEKLGAKIIQVSYDDPAALERALEGVNTVISTISGHNHTQLIAPQLALVEAARKVGVRRFAPSEFAFRGLHDDPVTLYELKAEVTDALKASGMEYTIFENGIFMNYLASGTPGIGHLKPLKYIFDVENCKANIPGDGETYIVLTRAEDVGKLVAASLDLEVWPEVSRAIGDRKTLNEIAREAEAVRGKRFDITYTPVEEIEKSMVPSPSSPFTNFFQQGLVALVTTDRIGYEEANLNGLCPQVKPVGTREFLETWWGKA